VGGWCVCVWGGWAIGKGMRGGEFFSELLMVVLLRSCLGIVAFLVWKMGYSWEDAVEVVVVVLKSNS